MKVLDRQQPQKIRQFRYAAASDKTHKMAELKLVIFSWAVTLRIYPKCLGIQMESSGVVVVPNRTCLIIRIYKSHHLHFEGKDSILGSLANARRRYGIGPYIWSEHPATKITCDSVPSIHQIR